MDSNLVGAIPELGATHHPQSGSNRAAADRSVGPAVSVEPAAAVETVRSGATPRRRPLRRSRAGAFCALAALFFVALALTPAPAAAQGVSTSAVRGQVTTSDGLPLSEVTVIVVHEPSGTRSTDVTDGEGLTLPLGQALDVVANHGLNPVEGDPNRPQVRPALFDRPRKVVLSAWGRFFEGLGGTRVGLFYVGQSGRPYSYVYAGDVNGDGLPGEGRARERFNDLIYVPEDVVDSPSMSLGSLFAFHSLIGLDDCLTRAQASVLARNACSSPWTNRLDLRVTQEMDLGGTGVEVDLDVLNVLNALDSDWGRVETTARAVQVLALDGRGDPAGLEGKGANPLVSNYRGPIRTTEEGSFAAKMPHVPGVPDSQWQAQLGVRVSW